MTGGLLEEAVERFISHTTEALDGLARSVARPLSGALADDVITEAFDIAAAFVDADGVHTDDELAALVACFSARPLTPRVPPVPGELRRSGLLDGRAGWIATPTPMYELLVDADRKAGTQLAWRYYEDAMHLAHAACGLDSLTTRSELEALERFRATLLATMEKGGLRNPWTGRTPLSGGLPPEAAMQRSATPPAGRVLPGAPVGEPAPTPAVTAPSPEPRPVEEVLSELNAMVGLAEVKAQVRTVANLLRVQALRRARHLPVPETSHHLVFTGNPGTGKTTVARLLAQIYRSLGVVAQGQLVETDRAGLVAGYVGQTALRTTEVFLSARGGVLLIDEAYALQSREGDFGHEAVDTLVKLLEDHRGDVVVIVAGYPDEMAAFLDGNPGLRSRFPTTIDFPDYTTDELVAIFEGLCRVNSYQLRPEGRERLRRRLAAAPRGKGFGNGRLARNLFESAIGLQATRVVALPDPSDADLCELAAQDIP